MNFAQNLRVLRKSREIKQVDLAECFQITQGAFSGWESGLYEPNFKTLCALADYFRVTTDQLLGRAPLPEAGSKKVKVRKLQRKGRCK